MWVLQSCKLVAWVWGTGSAAGGGAEQNRRPLGARFLPMRGFWRPPQRSIERAHAAKRRKRRWTLQFDV